MFNSNEDRNFAPRIANKEDACDRCYVKSSRLRRYSTQEPSYGICNRGCNQLVYEIHLSCLDCSEKNNVCPWCNASPYIKSDKVNRNQYAHLENDDSNQDSDENVN